MLLQQILYLTEYYLFFIQLCVISSFFDAENISRKFIVLAVTVRKIHGREVVSCYRFASLMAVKYLRRIIVLFLYLIALKSTIFSIFTIFTEFTVLTEFKIYLLYYW